MQQAKLILPFPPTVNHIWKPSRHGGVYLDAQARAYRLEVSSIVSKARTIYPSLKNPITSKIFLFSLFTPPNDLRRDLDNYNKVLWDSLTDANVWKDDFQIKSFYAQWMPKNKNNPNVIVVLTWEL